MMQIGDAKRERRMTSRHMSVEEKTGEPTVFKQFAIIALIFQIAIFILFWTCLEYGTAAITSGIIVDGVQTEIDHYYPMYIDIHSMMFIGFGFLMTFLKSYGFGAISLNFLVAAFCIEWSLLTNGFFASALYKGYNLIQIDITSLIDADFAAAAILISFGAIIGKTTPAQMLVMVFCECIFYSLNQTLYYHILYGVDMGGSITIHTFGAYFGLTVSMIISQTMRNSNGESINHPKKGSTKTSDLFSMIGTIFLWIFWPSFNAAFAVQAQQHRVVINTVISLCSSCFFTFLVDILIRGNHKFSMESIQNATLAGGVAVGGSSDLVLNPGGAILLGAIAGTVSTFGFAHIQAFLRRSIGLDDSCGVHNLHGMPGLIGAISGIVSSSTADTVNYGHSIGRIFPARAPSNATLAASYGVAPGLDRSAGNQALYQFYGLLMTLGIAIGSGIITGFIMKLPIFLPSGTVNESWGSVGKSLHTDHWYDDNLMFTVEEEEGEEKHAEDSKDHQEMHPILTAP